MNIIGAFDRGRIETIVPRPNSVLIMITGHRETYPKSSSKWEDILKLKFDDVDGRVHDIGSSDNVMSIEQAHKILDFVIENINCDVFVSCDAGMSRSPGIVVALEQIFNSKDVSDSYRHHNRFVKNRIRDVWYNIIWKGNQTRLLEKEDI